MKTIYKKYIVKNFDELTQEEKEEQRKINFTSICELVAEDEYFALKEILEELKAQLKYITFEDVYFDDNSQGFWIDSVKNLSINAQTKKIYIDNIDITITKYITSLKYLKVNNTWEHIKDIENKPGYKKIIEEIKKDFELFKNTINNAINKYYHNIYNIDDETMDLYLQDAEFEYYIGTEEE